MKARLVFLSVVSLALAGTVGWYARQMLGTGSTAATPAPPRSSVQTVNGETVVVVSPGEQRASHITVAPLAVTTTRPTTTAYATVIDLQPLFDLHNRIAAARADIGTFTPQAANSRTQYERMRTLFENGRNVSRKTLQDARTLMQADAAKLRSAQVALSDLDGALRQQFGGVLGDAAMAPSSTLFQRLRSGRAVVVRVTLPVNYGDAAPARMTIEDPDGRPIPVQKLSASPLADPDVQGSPWLYVAGQSLPAGTRTSANVPMPTPATPALLVPAPAVVWYGGQPWAYVRTSPDHFTRRYVPAANEQDQGFLVSSGFHAGDLVVTQGAQLLLSEELTPQGIPSACKDPPECDD